MSQLVYDDWRKHWPRPIVERETDVAIRWLRHYYGLDNGRPYTGASFEEVASRNPDPDTIDTADFTAISMLSVQVPATAALRLLVRDAPEISALLARIPSDLDLVDADAALLTAPSAADELWGLLRAARDGLGRTKTSKLMAAKRPRLIPIWDSFVGQATGLDKTGYWRQFQIVLRADDRRIWDWLGALSAELDHLPIVVSRLRILDVLLWMSVAKPGA